MGRCISVGILLIAGAMAAGEMTGVAATPPQFQIAETDVGLPSVDVELVIAIDVSYSMDADELTVQREGYCTGHYLQGIPAGGCGTSIRSLWGTADHARTCRWLNPVANDPLRNCPSVRFCAATGRIVGVSDQISP